MKSSNDKKYNYGSECKKKPGPKSHRKSFRFEEDEKKV
jgi:hypothetical protein